MTNKDLLNSTGNFTQYSVMACMGKEPKKRVDTWIYITAWLAVHLKLTQHCKSMIFPWKVFKKAVCLVHGQVCLINVCCRTDMQRRRSGRTHSNLFTIVVFGWAGLYVFFMFHFYMFLDFFFTMNINNFWYKVFI